MPNAALRSVVCNEAGGGSADDSGSRPKGGSQSGVGGVSGGTSSGSEGDEVGAGDPDGPDPSGPSAGAPEAAAA